MCSNPCSLADDHFKIQAEESLHLAVSESGQVLGPGAKLLVAFSGGPDSTALLAFASCLASELEIDLQACHVNHKLRGAESDADEEFCRNLCQEWKIPFHVESFEFDGDPATISENDLRNRRYEGISKVANEIGSTLCLTGHTMDDQVETMLFRLFRGTGPSGLLGIKHVRKTPEGVLIVRPLLSMRRRDCVNYLQRLGLEARRDSSNDDTSYSRNYIRNKVMPLIEDRFAGFVERIENFRKLLEGDEDLLRCLSEDAVCELRDPDERLTRHLQTDAYCWNLDQFNELPLSLRRRVLYQTLRDLKIEHDYQRIESLLDLIDADGSGALSLNDSWEVRIFRGEVIWRRRQKFADEEGADENDGGPDEIEGIEPSSARVLGSNLKEGTNLLLRLGLSMRIEKLDEPLAAISFPSARELQIVVDLSQIGDLELLQFRQRKPGDHIQPLGMCNSVRLKKYLHTHKSTETLSFSGKTLVLSNESEVLWVPGCGISQRIAVRERATHKITISKIAPDRVTFC
jgi:tRNA(Ile)-lysidine synthase